MKPHIRLIRSQYHCAANPGTVNFSEPYGVGDTPRAAWRMWKRQCYIVTRKGNTTTHAWVDGAGKSHEMTTLRDPPPVKTWRDHEFAALIIMAVGFGGLLLLCMIVGAIAKVAS